MPVPVQSPTPTVAKKDNPLGSRASVAPLPTYLFRLLSTREPDGVFAGPAASLGVVHSGTRVLQVPSGSTPIRDPDPFLTRYQVP
jgi:hypothetical protein